jgi:hypothetical protein
VGEGTIDEHGLARPEPDFLRPLGGAVEERQRERRRGDQQEEKA